MFSFKNFYAENKVKLKSEQFSSQMNNWKMREPPEMFTWVSSNPRDLLHIYWFDTFKWTKRL